MPVIIILETFNYRYSFNYHINNILTFINMKEKLDVVIIGGGHVGIGLVQMLSNLFIRCTIGDRISDPQLKETSVYVYLVKMLCKQL